MNTRQTQVPVNFTYKSFGTDSLDDAAYCFVHNGTIIFNQDLVDTVNLESAGKSSIQTVMHLKDGMCIEKIFDVSNGAIVERPQ